MYTFLLVIHALIAAALVGTILVQQSEGGSLGSGGNPGGLMSARGAANFLTRATSVLATVFVVMSILLAALATRQNGSAKVDTSLARKPVQASPASTQPATRAGDTSPQGSDSTVPLAR